MSDRTENHPLRATVALTKRLFHTALKDHAPPEPKLTEPPTELSLIDDSPSPPNRAS